MNQQKLRWKIQIYEHHCWTMVFSLGGWHGPSAYFSIQIFELEHVNMILFFHPILSSWAEKSFYFKVMQPDSILLFSLWVYVPYGGFNVIWTGHIIFYSDSTI